MDTNIDINSLTTEQKVVLSLAKKGYLTSGGDIQRALREPKYAEKLIIDNSFGLGDLDCNHPEGDGDCDHTALTPEEIQEVFDNDYTK